MAEIQSAIPAVQAALIASAEYRLTLARGVAARLRHDEDLHRLAMAGVFALEDLLFEMHRTPTGIAAEQRACSRDDGA